MLVVEAVNAFGSGVAGLSVLFPPAHSTHVCHSSPSRTLPWPVHSHHDFFVLDPPHAQALGGFGLKQTFSWLHELLSTHALKFRILAVDCSSTDKNEDVFSSRRASIVVQSHAEGFFPRFSSHA